MKTPPRRIAHRLHEDIAFRVLAANNTPDFRTISDFRKDHLEALTGLFLQVLALCQRVGMVKLGHVALDGTKVRANASKHQAMSYRRMKEKEAQLSAEVAELLRRAQEVDDDDDRRYGQDRRGDELPEELAFREGRLGKIREAMAALEAEAEAAAEQAEAEGKEHPGVPDDKAQRNFTDAESRIMPGPGGRDFQQAYNCQAVVDHAHQVIVAARASNQTSDQQQTVAMIEETISNTGVVPKEVSADAGYYSAKAVEDLQALGVDPYVAPEQTRHGRVPPPAPRGCIPNHLAPRDRMRRKLHTRRGRQRYALRMATVEPVFGQIKEGRGFRQFLLRGLEKVQGEWSLICTGHNLLKLFRFDTRRGRQRYALRMATVEPVFGQIKEGRGFRQFLLRGLEKVQGEWSLICTGHNLLKLFRFDLPANIGGPESGIRTDRPFHWLPSIPTVSKPTTSPCIP